MHEVGNMIIEGARVKLLPISEDDTKNIVKWRNHVRSQFLDRRLFTEESHNYWLHTMVETGKVAQFVIEIDGNDKIGSVFLRDIDRKNKKAEFGIFIGEDRYQGKGYGSKGLSLLEKEFPTITQWDLCTVLQDAGMVAFYEKNGYHQTHIEPEKEGMDMVYMKKLIEK